MLIIIGFYVEILSKVRMAISQLSCLFFLRPVSLPSKHRSHIEDVRSDTYESRLEQVCSHCGGNGYMKSNPNCYHTCLICLGRGIIFSSKPSQLASNIIYHLLRSTHHAHFQLRLYCLIAKTASENSASFSSKCFSQPSSICT